jgi:hypothetical protein
MHPDYRNLVAECQTVTDNLTPEMFYKFYLDLLPRRKFFTKYISAKKDAGQDRDALFNLFSKEYGFSVTEFDLFMDYVDTTPQYIDNLANDVMELTGLTEKEVKKQYKI